MANKSCIILTFNYNCLWWCRTHSKFSRLTQMVHLYHHVPYSCSLLVCLHWNMTWLLQMRGHADVLNSGHFLFLFVLRLVSELQCKSAFSSPQWWYWACWPIDTDQNYKILLPESGLNKPSTWTWTDPKSNPAGGVFFFKKNIVLFKFEVATGHYKQQ